MNWHETVAALTTLERDQEQKQLETAMANFREGKGNSLLIKGKGEYGHRVLVRNILKNSSVPIHHSACNDLAPFTAFRSIFPEFFQQFQENRESVIRNINSMKHPIFRGKLGQITRRFARQKSLQQADLEGESLPILFARHLLELELPCIVFIEDIQWADNASLELLAFLLEHLKADPIFFILTVDTEIIDTPTLPTHLLGKKLSLIEQIKAMEVHQTPDTTGKGIHAFLKKIENSSLVHKLEFMPLSEAKQLKILRRTFGPTLFSEEMQSKILALAQGNSYFLAQILLYLSENVLSFRGKRWQLKYSEQEVVLPEHIEFIIQENNQALSTEIKAEIARASLMVSPVFIEDWWQSGDLSFEEFEQILIHCCNMGVLLLSQDKAWVSFASDTQKKIFQEMEERDKQEIYALLAEYSEKKAAAGVVAHYLKNSPEPSQALDYLILAGIEAEKLRVYEEAFLRYKEAAYKFPESQKLFEELWAEQLLGKPKTREKDKQLQHFLEILHLYRVAGLITPQTPLLDEKRRAAFRKYIYQYSPSETFSVLVSLVLYLSNATKERDKIYDLEESVFFIQTIIHNCLPGRDYSAKSYFYQMIFHHPRLHSQEAEINLPKTHEKWGNQVKKKNLPLKEFCGHYFQAAYFSQARGDFFHAARLYHKIHVICRKETLSSPDASFYRVEALQNLGAVYLQAAHKAQEEDERIRHAIQAMAAYVDAANADLELKEISWLALHIAEKAYQICEEFYIDEEIALDVLTSAKNKYETLLAQEYSQKALIIVEKSGIGAAEVLFQTALQEDLLPEIKVVTAQSNVDQQLTSSYPYVFLLLIQDGPLAKQFQYYTEKVKIHCPEQESNLPWLIDEGNEQTFSIFEATNAAQLYMKTMNFREESVLISYT